MKILRIVININTVTKLGRSEWDGRKLRTNWHKFPPPFLNTKSKKFSSPFFALKLFVCIFTFHVKLSSILLPLILIPRGCHGAAIIKVTIGFIRFLSGCERARKRNDETFVIGIDIATELRALKLSKDKLFKIINFATSKCVFNICRNIFFTMLENLSKSFKSFLSSKALAEKQ